MPFLMLLLGATIASATDLFACEGSDGDALCYLGRYSDLAAAYCSSYPSCNGGQLNEARCHYVRYGEGEGRQFSCESDLPPPPSPSPPWRKLSEDEDEGESTYIIIPVGLIAFILSIVLRCFCKHADCCSSRQQTDPSGPTAVTGTNPNAISVEMESASPRSSVDLPSWCLTPMSELERELYARLFKSLGVCPVGRAAAALTFGHYQSAQLPPNELDVIWEM